MDYFPLQNDAVVLGLLMVLLGAVFWTSARPSGFWKRFYTYVPALLICYFLPSVFGSLGLVSEASMDNLYHVASRYLLPTSLILLTVSMDLPAVLRLGPKALIMFFTGTAGIVIGGPLAILLVSFVSPETVGGTGPDAVWRGLTTVAGSWIGGGANQAAMKEVFEVGDDLFSAMIAVDVLVANVWMAVLLFAAGRSEAIDARTKANTDAIKDLQRRVEAYHAKIARIPKLADTMVICAVGFGLTALAHVGADLVAPAMERASETVPAIEQMSLTSKFLWLIVIATTGGVLLSFTRARELEGAGASRLGSAFLYVLVATIGLHMNLRAVAEIPGLFVVGLLWIGFHAALLIAVALVIRAPVFFLAVGSQANVGGAASAPVVASAFHPALAPVGVLLAVVGYALGTYAAYFCGQLLRVTAGSV